jgi:hypothetical protein
MTDGVLTGLKSIRESFRLQQQWHDAIDLWKDLGKNRRLTIVPGTVRHPDDPATGAGELRACVLIPQVIQAAFGDRDIEIRFPHELPDPESLPAEQLDSLLGQNDLILLGGSMSNRITRLAIRRLGEQSPDDLWIAQSLPEADDEDYWVSYRTGTKHYTKYRARSSKGPFSMEEDFGIFLVRPNCFALDEFPTSRLIIFYGAHTYGTEAAANLFFSFRSAAFLASRFRKSADTCWRTQIDGEVRVTGQRGLDTVARLIEIIAPSDIVGWNEHNPVLAPSITTHVLRSTFPFIMTIFTFSSAMLIGGAFFGLGKYLGIAGASLSAYCVARFMLMIHKVKTAERRLRAAQSVMYPSDLVDHECTSEHSFSSLPDSLWKMAPEGPEIPPDEQSADKPHSDDMSASSPWEAAERKESLDRFYRDVTIFAKNATHELREMSDMMQESRRMLRKRRILDEIKVSANQMTTSLRSMISVLEHAREVD